jgi:NitT/TauT family transport system permease protein
MPVATEQPVRRETVTKPFHRHLPDWAQQVIFLVVILVIWEVVVRVRGTNPLVLPRPTSIFHRFGDILADGTLLTATWNTVRVLIESVVLGTAIAIVLAAVGVASRIGGVMLRAMNSIMNPLPGVAVLPLVIIWFGFGSTSVIVVVLNTVVWVMAVNLYAGFESTPLTLRRVAKSLELPQAVMLRDVYLTSSVPHLLTGIRLAWAYGWRTIVAVELILGSASGQGGLGSTIFQARYNNDTVLVFACLMMIIILGLVMESLIRWAETRTAARWGLTRQT